MCLGTPLASQSPIDWFPFTGLTPIDKQSYVFLLPPRLATLTRQRLGGVLVMAMAIAPPGRSRGELHGSHPTARGSGLLESQSL